MSANVDIANRPDYDEEIQAIADYVLNYSPTSDEAWDTARLCLMDTLGCGMLALRYPECRKHLGPLVPGTLVPNGARVPGTNFILDPVKAAWDIGCIIRWLDFNDTWLAAEWGHPSDNLGAILAVTDHLSRQNSSNGQAPFTMQDVLHSMIMAHEIQGIMALENSFNRVGLCHVLLVRLASVAVATKLMGGNREHIMAAISQSWVDGSSLRTYRHAPNAGSRKSWAAGDATSRAVRLADISMRGEMGVPTVLSAPEWGFYDVSFSHTNNDLATKPDDQRAFKMQREYASYTMENILFKISFPAEFHAQTACEAAVQLHPIVKQRYDEIEKVLLTTHDSALRIISKQGELNNPADRDHCLQYMVAVALLSGDVVADNYENSYHQTHPEIDQLRERMEVSEDLRYSREYHDPDKRSIANAVQLQFKDGSLSERIEIEYPLGHRRRRSEGVPVLEEKFKRNLATRFSAGRCEEIFALCNDAEKLSSTPVHQFVDLWVV